MTKARTLADFVSSGNPLADGTISVAEVVGAAPLASPDFTGGIDVTGASAFHGNGNAPIAWGDTTDVGFLSFDGSGNAIVRSATGARLNFQVNANRDVLSLQNGSTIFNESGNNQDFRVESNGNANMLFVDGGGDYVSVGTAGNLNGKLNVAGSIVATNAQSIDPDALAAGNVALGQIADGSGWGAVGISWKGSGTGDTAAIGYAGESLYFAMGDGTNINSFATVFRLGRNEIVVNEDSNNTDFRVESDSNANMLFVDGGNDRVGVGTNAPLGLGLTINGGTTAGAYFYGGTNNRRQLIFTSFNTASLDAGHTIQASSTSGRIRLVAGSREHMKIDAVSNTTVFNEDGADQDFRVESDSNTHMLFVDAGNNFVGIDTSNPVSPLVVSNGGASGIEFHPELSTNFNRITNFNRSTSAYNELGIDALAIELRPSGVRKCSINASDMVVNQDSADYDFRVESDSNAYMLFVDAGQNAVTINGSTVATDGSNNYPLSVRANTAADAIAVVGRASDDIGELGFYESDGTTQLGNVQARPSDGGMRFRALPTSATMHFDLTDSNGNLQNRMLFQEAELRINDTGDDYDFRVESNNNANAFFVDAGANNVCFGAGAASGSTNMGYFHVAANNCHLNVTNTQTSNITACYYANRQGSDGTSMFFQRGGTSVGSISVTSSGTTYSTSSDHRLKENVVYDWDATTRLKQLKPARFNFIVDADTTVDGFLAHEAQAVVPEAVHGTHNQVDDDGVAVMQGIDQSKLVPLLVKTIQELEARITALENA